MFGKKSQLFNDIVYTMNKNLDKREKLVEEFMQKIGSDITRTAENGMSNLILSFKDSLDAYNSVYSILKKQGFSVKKIKSANPREYYLEVNWG